MLPIFREYLRANYGKRARGCRPLPNWRPVVRDLTLTDWAYCVAAGLDEVLDALPVGMDPLAQWAQFVRDQYHTQWDVCDCAVPLAAWDIDVSADARDPAVYCVMCGHDKTAVRVAPRDNEHYYAMIAAVLMTAEKNTAARIKALVCAFGFVPTGPPSRPLPVSLLHVLDTYNSTRRTATCPVIACLAREDAADTLDALAQIEHPDTWDWQWSLWASELQLYHVPTGTGCDCTPPRPDVSFEDETPASLMRLLRWEATCDVSQWVCRYGRHPILALYILAAAAKRVQEIQCPRRPCHACDRRISNYWWCMEHGYSMRDEDLNNAPLEAVLATWDAGALELATRHPAVPDLPHIRRRVSAWSYHRLTFISIVVVSAVGVPVSAKRHKCYC